MSVQSAIARKAPKQGSGSLAVFQQKAAAAISPNPKVKSGNELYRAGVNGREQADLKKELKSLSAEDRARAKQFLSGLGFSDKTIDRLANPRPTPPTSGLGLGAGFGTTDTYSGG